MPQSGQKRDGRKQANANDYKRKQQKKELLAATKDIIPNELLSSILSEKPPTPVQVQEVIKTIAESGLTKQQIQAALVAVIADLQMNARGRTIKDRHSRIRLTSSILSDLSKSVTAEDLAKPLEVSITFKSDKDDLGDPVRTTPMEDPLEKQKEDNAESEK